MTNLDDIKKHLRRYRDFIINEKREANGEVFTPTDLANQILNQFPKSEFIDDKKTWIDHSCGNGQFLSEILIRKLENGHSLQQALSTIYGVEICEENVLECRERLLCGQEHLRAIVEQNIVCADALRYHYRFDGTHPYDDEAKAKESNDRFEALFSFE